MSEKNGEHFKDVCEQTPKNSEQLRGTVLLITYYGFKAPISNAVENLVECGWRVLNFSLFRWKFDQFDKKKAYLDFLIDIAAFYKPDALLFWYFGLEPIELQTLRRCIDESYAPYTPFLLYNWNDPYTWVGPQSAQFAEQSKYCDAVITCCGDTIPQYLKNLHQFEKKATEPSCSSSRAVILEVDEAATDAEKKMPDANAGDKQISAAQLVSMQSPGYVVEYAKKYLSLQSSGRVHSNSRFQCDVSIACTNLYDSNEIFPRQRINRRQLIDAIYAEKSINFHLYGPERFAAMYPDAYRGELSYEDTYRVAHTSCITINTHVVSHGVSQYGNERTSIVLGSGGLLLTDISVSNAIENNSSKESDKAEEFYVLMESTVAEVVAQIKEMLHQWSDARCDAMRAAALNFAQKNLTWQSWAQKTSSVLENALAYVDMLYGSAEAQDLRKERRERLFAVENGISDQRRRSSSDIGAEQDPFEKEAIEALKILDPDFGALRQHVPKSDFMQRPGAVSEKTVRKYYDQFDRLSECSEDDFEKNWISLQLTVNQNPTINLDLLLDNYWRQKDAFH